MVWRPGVGTQEFEGWQVGVCVGRVPPARNVWADGPSIDEYGVQLAGFGIWGLSPTA